MFSWSVFFFLLKSDKINLSPSSITRVFRYLKVVFSLPGFYFVNWFPWYWDLGNETVPFEGPSIQGVGLLVVGIAAGDNRQWAQGCLLSPHVSLYASVSLTALCFTVSPAVQDPGVLGTREDDTGLVLPGGPNLGEDVHRGWHW